MIHTAKSGAISTLIEIHWLIRVHTPAKTKAIPCHEHSITKTNGNQTKRKSRYETCLS